MSKIAIPQAQSIDWEEVVDKYNPLDLETTYKEFKVNGISIFRVTRGFHEHYEVHGNDRIVRYKRNTGWYISEKEALALFNKLLKQSLQPTKK